MKNVDVSKSVMNKVVRFERTRTRSWFRTFILSIVILLFSLVTLVVLMIRILSERQVWELLTLFGQDPEMISSYWQDTLWVIWEESPHRIITLTAIIVLAVIGIYILTRRKRKVLKKKLDVLEKYK
jgi:hypothetical protein